MGSGSTSLPSTASTSERAVQSPGSFNLWPSRISTSASCDVGTCPPGSSLRPLANCTWVTKEPEDNDFKLLSTWASFKPATYSLKIRHTLTHSLSHPSLLLPLKTMDPSMTPSHNNVPFTVYSLLFFQLLSGSKHKPKALDKKSASPSMTLLVEFINILILYISLRKIF